MKDLSHFGLVLGNDSTKTENQFLQLIRHDRMIEAVKQTIININLIRATIALNDELRDFLVPRMSAAPFLSTLKVYQFFQETAEGERPKVLAELVEPDNLEQEWIDYEPRKHGYLPLGFYTASDQLTLVSKYKGQLLGVLRMLKLLEPPQDAAARRDLDARTGHSHSPERTYMSGRANAVDGLYRFQLLD